MPSLRDARMTEVRPFRPTASMCNRPLFTDVILGGKFERGAFATRTTHFLAKFRLGLPTQGADQRNKRIETTAHTERPPKDQYQHHTLTNNLDKRNYRRNRTTKTSAKRPIPAPKANQQFGQTKPPREQNDQTNATRPIPTPSANQQFGKAKQPHKQNENQR